MSRSWFERQVIKIRDEGQEAKPAVYKLEKDGTPALDEQKMPIIEKPAEEARNAWPEDAYVLIKDRIGVGDYETIQRLQIHPPSFVADAESPDKGQVHADLGILYHPLIYAGVLVVGFESPESGVFEDPETGATMTMPKDEAGRLEVARKLPLEVCGFVFNEIHRRLQDSPLPETKPLKSSNKGSKHS